MRKILLCSAPNDRQVTVCDQTLFGQNKHSAEDKSFHVEMIANSPAFALQNMITSQ